MAFFDSKTVSEIKSAMDPEDLISLICWEVPLLLADILNLVFIVSHLLYINIHLTIISIVFIILARLIRHPIEKVKTTLPNERRVSRLISTNERTLTYFLWSRCTRWSSSWTTSCG